jgi:hypothetical protein
MKYILAKKKVSFVLIIKKLYKHTIYINFSKILSQLIYKILDFSKRKEKTDFDSTSSCSKLATK